MPLHDTDSGWKAGTAGLTTGEIFGPAMKLTDQRTADAYFERLVQHACAIDPATPEAEARSNMRANLGYWAGYYDDETRARVERLYACAHPVFGAIAEKGAPTQQEAFDSGRLIGVRIAMREALASIERGETGEAAATLRRAIEGAS